MSIKLIVFDMAGTTLKDDHDVSRAFRAALLKSGYEVPLNMIDPLMGYEKNLAIRQILRLREHNDAQITNELVREIHKEFVKQMIAYYQTGVGVEALPNVEETFALLHKRGVKIGINTGFSRDIAMTIVNRLQWIEKGLVDYVVGSDEVELGRPHPYMIQKLMTEAGVTNAKQVAKIGDTEVDVREGQNAGCRYVIGITTGTFKRDELVPYKPTHIIDDIRELVDIIDQ
jgi:phosphonatase-like hydrolase